MSLQSGRSLSSLVTVSLASALVVIGAVAAHAASDPTATPAVTTSPTAAASTAAATQRIDRATAYWFCRATVYKWAYRNPSVDPFTVNTFAKASITARGSGWRVMIVGKPHKTYGAHTKADWCDVEGTAAHPELVDYLMPR